MIQRYLLALLIILSPVMVTAAELPAGIIELPARTAPPMKLANMDGESFELASVKGQWAFVHFWASWCGPCRREMPTIQTLIRDMQTTPMHIVIVNTAETADQVFEFLAAVAPEINSLLDLDGQVTEAWQPRGLPSTYLVDPQGQIRYVVLGGRPWDKPTYQGFLKQLAEENK